MKWETVKIESTNVGRKNAFATVGRGQIVFNSTATKQIRDVDEIKYVEIMTGSEGNTTFVGFAFKKELGENCLEVKKRLDKNKEVASVIVSSKVMMEKLFGKVGSKAGSTQYPVKLDEGPKGESLLVVKLA